MALPFAKGFVGDWYVILLDNWTAYIGRETRPGYWDVTQVNMRPSDGGTFGLTEFSRQQNVRNFGPARGSAGSAGSGMSRPTGGGLAGAPPNARLADILAMRRGSAPANAGTELGSEPVEQPPSEDEP